MPTKHSIVIKNIQDIIYFRVVATFLMTHNRQEGLISSYVQLDHPLYITKAALVCHTLDSMDSASVLSMVRSALVELGNSYSSFCFLSQGSVSDNEPKNGYGEHGTQHRHVEYGH